MKGSSEGLLILQDSWVSHRSPFLQYELKPPSPSLTHPAYCSLCLCSIQLLCLCVRESLSSNPPPAAPFAPFFYPVFPWASTYMRFSLTTSQLPTEQRLNSEWPTTCFTLLQQAGGEFPTRSLTVQAVVCPSVWEPPLVHFLSLLFPFAFSLHICCQSPLPNLYTSRVAVFSICCLLSSPVFVLVRCCLANLTHLTLIVLSHQAERPAEWPN